MLMHIFQDCGDMKILKTIFLLELELDLGSLLYCPLLCVSKLQTDIDFSTPHSEYVALFISVRALLPLKVISKK